MVARLAVSRSLEAASTLMAVTPGDFLHYLAFPTYLTCQCQNWTSLPTGCSCAGNSSWASAPGPQRATEWQGAQALC